MLFGQQGRFYLLLSALFQLSNAQSWLTCPPSFNPVLNRTGNTVGPCDGDIDTAPITNMRAGDRLKVGWPSINKGGGFVRLSLVHATNSTKQVEFNKNVLKQTCFGYDSRPNRYSFGNCVHPCNGRPGCEYANTLGDTERFDTTLTVPLNLNDGIYVLQWMAITGNNPLIEYSCSKLNITGGSTSLTCPKSSSIPQATCTQAFGPNVSALLNNTLSGPFCFSADGLATIDSKIADVPVNVKCDPRLACSYSVNPTLCKEELKEDLDPLLPNQSCPNIPDPITPCIPGELNTDPVQFCISFKTACTKICSALGSKNVTNQCIINPGTLLGVDASCICDKLDKTPQASQEATFVDCNAPTNSTTSTTTSKTTSQTKSTTGSSTTSKTTTKVTSSSKTSKSTTSSKKTTTSTTKVEPSPLNSQCPKKIVEGSNCNEKKRQCSEKKIATCVDKKWRLKSCRPGQGTCRLNRKGEAYCDKYRSPCNENSLLQLSDVQGLHALDF